MRKDPAGGRLAAVAIHPRPARALRATEPPPPLPPFPDGVRVLPLEAAYGRRHLALAPDGWGLVLGLGATGPIVPGPAGIPVEWVAEESFPHDLDLSPDRSASAIVDDFWRHANLTLANPLCQTRNARFGDLHAAGQDRLLLALIACAAGLAADRPRVARLTGLSPHPLLPQGGLTLDPEPADPRLAALVRIVGRLVLVLRPHGAWAADLRTVRGPHRDRLSNAQVVALPLLEKGFAPLGSAHGRMAARALLIRSLARLAGADPDAIGTMLSLGPDAAAAARRLCAGAAAAAPASWAVPDADLAALSGPP